MDNTDKQAALYAALCEAQKAFSPALKTATNPHFKSKYANLAACVEAVMDALNANGIALVQRTLYFTDSAAVETIFYHKDGGVLECGPLVFPASKQDAQGYMSALTYARRGSLMAACGIAPEDDDGNAASKLQQQQPAKPAPFAPDLAQMRIELSEAAQRGSDALKACWLALNEAYKPALNLYKDALKAVAAKADSEGAK